MDSQTLGKFFKGIVLSGCWSCFDEFDRIDIEVLSVVASQVHEIQRAKNSGSQNFYLEENFLTINRSCNIFITMNAAYTGRVNLPENLKALFRPVAMNRADFGKIAEIFLFAAGFETS
jgi:dynein heavy chain, axonemal